MTNEEMQTKRIELTKACSIAWNEWFYLALNDKIGIVNAKIKFDKVNKELNAIESLIRKVEANE